MLDPSSSEEESDEGLEEESRDVLVAAGASQRASPAPAREGRRDAPGRAGGGSAARPVSPSPSVLSEGRDEPERQLDEEQERRIRLQLYVLVVRCIAYPFNAKQPTDMARRQQKVSCTQDWPPLAATSFSLEFSPGYSPWVACPLPLFNAGTIFVGLRGSRESLGLEGVRPCFGWLGIGLQRTCPPPAPPFPLAEAVSLASVRLTGSAGCAVVAPGGAQLRPG